MCMELNLGWQIMIGSNWTCNACHVLVNNDPLNCYIAQWGTGNQWWHGLTRCKFRVGPAFKYTSLFRLKRNWKLQKWTSPIQKVQYRLWESASELGQFNLFSWNKTIYLQFFPLKEINKTSKKEPCCGIPQCVKQSCYLDLCLGGPEDDSIKVEICSLTPMLMNTINKLLC
jgi:hypothetical protein